MTKWLVYLKEGQKHRVIDYVYFDDGISADEVHEALISHDTYDPSIYVSDGSVTFPDSVVVV